MILRQGCLTGKRADAEGEGMGLEPFGLRSSACLSNRIERLIPFIIHLERLVNTSMKAYGWQVVRLDFLWICSRYCTAL